MSNPKGPTRYLTVFQTALDLVRTYGIQTLDAIPDPRARVAAIINLEVQLRAQTNCAVNTSKHHIARACRRLRADPHAVATLPDGFAGGRPRKEPAP